MKKFSLIMLLSISVLFLFSCKDNETGPDDTSTDGYKINVFTKTDNSEVVSVESDTFYCSKKYSIGISCPKVLEDCILACFIYHYDINGNKVLGFQDSVAVFKEEALKEFSFTSFVPRYEGDNSIEVIINEADEIKLSRDFFVILE